MAHDNPLEYAHHLFLNGEEIKDLIIPDGVSSINTGAFFNCSGLTSVTIPKSIISISDEVFKDCTNLTSLTIANGVTSIGNEAFRDCSDLTLVDIPNSVTIIGSSAFSGCSSLNYVNLPNNETSIGNCAFMNCCNLTTVTIPNKVCSIGNEVFKGCSNLTSITIGGHVSSIGSECFAYCPELEEVYCYSESVPITSDNAFSGSYIEYATLYVSESVIDDYENTSPWSGFGNYMNLDETAFRQLTIIVGKNGRVTYGTSNVSNTSQTFNVKESSDVTLTLTPNNGYRLSSVKVNNVDKTADVNEGTLLLSNVSSDLTVNVQFILDGESATVTITDAGVATFCSDKDLDFSEVSGLKAYTGAGFNKSTGQLIMLEVTDVPAGTGLLLKGTAGSYEIPEKASSSVYANLLMGVTSATTISQTDGGYTNYILANGSHGVGFYIVEGSGQLAAGKSYLRIPTAIAGARQMISFNLNDEPTSISAQTLELGDTEGFYTLNGQRINGTPVRPGIYIRNGQKIIIKKY